MTFLGRFQECQEKGWNEMLHKEDCKVMARAKRLWTIDWDKVDMNKLHVL